MKFICFHPDAYLQFIDWQENHPENFEKVKKLISEITRDPFKGTGKPEPLKHQFKGYWSRRINQEHRIVYKVEVGAITIVSLSGHY